MATFSQLVLFFVLFCTYICAAQPSRFCSRLTRDCTTECRENGTSLLFECVADCTCLDPQIAPLLGYEECIQTFEEARSNCRGRSCGLGRYFNDFCSELPGRCCDPYELDLVECANNETEPLCCDGEWICPNGNSNQFSCSDRLISSACCCDASDTFSCFQGERLCCPNDGQWTCAIDFPNTLYACSDGNLYETNEMADSCCCDPFEEPGRFGNDDCPQGRDSICCPDGTFSCANGNGRFSCGEGQPLLPDQIAQGQNCVCEAPDFCSQVLICCDGVIFSTPCAAQAACYDTQDEEFCSYQFNVLENGSCQPRQLVEA